MAEQLIPNIYEQTGEAFNRKLDTLVGFAQQVKRNQFVKQQQAEQFARQKDLVQFRADVQLEKQKQYFQEVTIPQQEAELEREQLQDFQDRIQSSIQQTKENIEQHTDNLYSKQYSSVHNYNLLDARFAPERNEDGTVSEAIYLNVGNEQGEDAYRKVDFQTYRDQLAQVSNFANFLDRIKQAEHDGELATLNEGNFAVQDERSGQTVDVYRIGQNNAKAYIQRIRQEPQFRQRQIQLYNNEQLDIAKADLTPDGEGSGDTPKSWLYPAVGHLMGKLNQQPVQKYGNVEESFWPWGGADKRVGQIDYQADVQSVKKQIRSVMSDVYGIEPSEIASPEVVRAIVQGNEANLEGNALDYAKKARQDDGLNELFTAYDFYLNSYDEWAKQSASSVRPDRVKLNFDWTGGDIGGAFDIIDANDPAARAEMNARALHNQMMKN